MAFFQDSIKFAKLTDSNYGTWSLRAKATLIERGVWESIEPGYNEGGMSPAENKANNRALSILYLLVEDEYLDDIKDCSTAREAWKTLEQVNTKCGLLNIMQLMKEMFTVRKGADEGMKEYLHRVNDIHGKLKTSGYGFGDKEVAVMMMMGLPDEYEALIANLEQNEETLDLKTVKTRLLLEEKRRLSRNKERERREDEVKALFTKSSKVSSVDKKGSEKNSEEKRPGTHPNKPIRKIFRCYCCGKIGHIARNCKFGKEENTGKQSEQESNDHKKEAADTRATKVETHQALQTIHKNTGVGAGDWFLDCACSEHMTPEDGKFITVTPCEGLVTVADGEKATSQKKGMVILRTATINGGKSFSMENVLHVPNLDSNLLSVGRLTEKGYKLWFEDDYVIVYDQDSNVVMQSKRVNRLYCITEERDLENAFKVKEEGNTVEIFHRRLGHPNYEVCKQIMKMTGHELTGEPHHNCEICIKGKIKRKPFPESETKVGGLLDRVHSDVMAIDMPSRGGAKYVATFLDEYSRYSEVYLLKTKDQVFEAFKTYKNKMENQTGKKIKILRTDNGGEYDNKLFNNYLSEQGIVTERSVPYSPQQNGKAERLNQTLMNITRCLLIQSQLPKNMWGEAINAANFLRNMTPTKKSPMKTPEEEMFGSPPDYSKIKVYGCRVWMKTPKERLKSKLEDRAIPGIFVGYPNHGNGYIIWNPKEDKFFISRDVIFEENVFPMKKETQGEPPERRNENDYEVFSLRQKQKIGDTEKEQQVKHPINVDGENENNKQQSPNEEVHQSDPEPVLRRSKREKKHTICTAACCHKTLHIQPDPNNLSEARCSEDWEEWKTAIEHELQCLRKKQTWEIVPRSGDIHTIDSKWVFRKKYDEERNIKEYRARLVARGFQQIPHLEYNEVFAPVARLKSVRTILSIAASRKWRIYQFDITSAYLNGDLKEDVYMEIPEDGDDSSIDRKHFVCKLRKALYGLKQGGREWNETIHSFLLSLGLLQSKVEPCVYFNQEISMFLSLHVDDILLACESEDLYINFGDRLKERFEARDLGEAHRILSIRVERKEDGTITMDQEHFINELLEKYQMTEAKERTTPCDSNTKFPRSTNQKMERNTSLPYRQLLEALMYIANATRPDVSYIINYLGQFNECYQEEHWKTLKGVLRYLKGSRHLKLSYSPKKTSGTVFSDSDWAGDPLDRKSTSGYAFVLAGGATSWASRKQKSTALSSVEAELLAMVQATKELKWLIMFLGELQALSMLPALPVVYVDSQGAIAACSNPVISERSKHVEISNFFVRDMVKQGYLKYEFIRSENNTADILTKGLPREKFSQHRNSLGLN